MLYVGVGIMKVILGSKDIENIIKEKFEGVNTVKFTPEGEAELDVDYSNFKERKDFSKKEPESIKIPNTPTPTKEKTEEEIKQGLMVSGGEGRSIQHMG